jgi:hypothetical protein
LWKSRETRSNGSAPESREDTGEGHYFEGATYAGLLGAGAAFGQQEAARRAAAAAIKAIFICGSVWFDSCDWHETHTSLGRRLAVKFVPARQKTKQNRPRIAPE